MSIKGEISLSYLHSVQSILYNIFGFDTKSGLWIGWNDTVQLILAELHHTVTTLYFRVIQMANFLKISSPTSFSQIIYPKMYENAKKIQKSYV